MPEEILVSSPRELQNKPAVSHAALDEHDTSVFLRSAVQNSVCSPLPSPFTASYSSRARRQREGKGEMPEARIFYTQQNHCLHRSPIGTRHLFVLKPYIYNTKKHESRKKLRKT
ncbi:hypothetical protein NDU88_005525 [Pleurodeles waltl]|uniref:Uncharacterized protein n=1 Tax=Pleurodeles waltl TaxID=8319 RepID=A0AAV7NQW1_PLEWA|nr:hypothetical protein NDU88_005525 [Pleurodeles waltl]